MKVEEIDESFSVIFSVGALYRQTMLFIQRVRDAAIAVTNASEEAGLTNLLYIIFQLKSMAPRLVIFIQLNCFHIYYKFTI